MKDDMFGFAHHAAAIGSCIREPFSQIEPDHSHCDEWPTDRTIERWKNESFITKHREME